MPIAAFKGCAAYEPGNRDNLYGYKPSLIAGIIFTTAFFCSTIAHVFQSWSYRTRWTWLFALGTTTEVVGWVGRTWSSQCPTNLNAFLMQITALVIGPTFFTAGIYIILGRLLALTPKGLKLSILSPKMYLIVFCTCDIISLVIQAIGGVKASAAVSAVPPGESRTGTNIMVAGIVFQLASITIFAIFFFEFVRRAYRPAIPVGAVPIISRNSWKLIWTTMISGILVYIRSIYRTIELAQGWSGYLIMREGYFIGLDGALMIIAMVSFNLMHPGRLLQPGITGAGETSKSS